jgi:exopolysaccharide biosynthesis polyprenyl glycosylphosphotransferase
MTRRDFSIKLRTSAIERDAELTELPAIGDVRGGERTRGVPREQAILRLAHGRFWRDALRRRMLAAADLLALVVTTGALLAWTHGEAHVLGVLLFAPGWLVIAKIVGLYDLDHRQLRHLTTDEFSRVVVYVLAGTAAMAALFLVLPFGADSLRAPDRVRLWLLIGGTTLIFRALARYAWRKVTLPERAVLVGSGPLAAQFKRKLELFPDIHVRIDQEYESCSAADVHEPGFLDGIDRIIVALPNVDEEVLEALVGAARRGQVKLSVVPPMRGMFGVAAQLSRVADVALVEFNTWDTSRTTLLAKRALDLVVSGAGLVLLSPLLLVIALAVKLTSPGPVSFVQLRAGAHGRPFRMLKFRTMRVDAPERLAELVDIEALPEPAFKLADDPRVTPIGWLLRRASLDELPQLINILRGEMSLVGPRPEQVEVVELYRPEERFRLAAKPGLTGPMQVNGRGALRFEERLALERDYIENLSFLGDLRILALTITPVLRRRGAY